MAKTVIKIEKLTKEYMIYKSNMKRMISLLLNRKDGIKKVALNGIDLEIQKGEKVCIIGGVGSGRTTLLKLISGISFPTSGSVKVNGKVDVVFDLKTGFDRELSGRDNLYIKGSILGWSRSEIKAMEDEIIEFSGIGNYIDLPIKNYSPGMAGRLGFAILAARTPDILLMDEGFAVGNKEYRVKCLTRLKELVGDPDVTFVMVSKNIGLAKSICERALVIDKGEILFDGTVNKAFKYYKTHVHKGPKTEEDEMLDQAIEMQFEDSDEMEYDF